MEVDSEDACDADDGILPVKDGLEIVEGVVLTDDRYSQIMLLKGGEVGFRVWSG